MKRASTNDTTDAEDSATSAPPSLIEVDANRRCQRVSLSLQYANVKHTTRLSVATPISATPDSIRTFAHSNEAATESRGGQYRGHTSLSMGKATLLLLAGAATALKSDPYLPHHGADFTISRLPMPRNVQPLADLQITDHVVELKRGNSKSLSSIFVQTLRKQSMAALEGDERLGVRPGTILVCWKGTDKNLNRTEQHN